MPGKVTLVGAGPGDPGLLTVKGRAALEGAEVVVYDRLVGPEILALMPEGAKKIDVGKTASRHPVPQGQINEVLVEEARAGHNVVRLKGGTPSSSAGAARSWRRCPRRASILRRSPASPPPSRRRPTGASR